MRKCRMCPAPLPPAAKCTTMIGKKRLCSPDCAAKWSLEQAVSKRERDYRKSRADARDRLKTRQDWLREAQAAFNKYIRTRDDGKECISCGRYHQGQIHAGHYRTTKAASGIRFHTFNVHSQCMPCNTHLSGNVVEYRINLVKRICQHRVEWLESQNETRRYSVEYLKRLKSVFSRRARHIERLRNRVNTIANRKEVC